ncbi:MAG: 50S ribosomal protein L9 [Candidatus Neomarinimicrobiota bacterium]
MDIILLKDLKNLGQAGDVVNVKPGYARNKLIPEGVALRASKRNLAIADEQKITANKKRAREESFSNALADVLSKTEITIEAQVGEEDKMFGSVTVLDIHKSLESKGIEIERSAILLEEPIKSLGIYHIPVHISSDVKADVKIYVIKS